MKYAVICRGDGIPGIPPCGQVELSEEQYLRQLSNPDALWYCPRCRGSADWDDDCEASNGEPEVQIATDNTEFLTAKAPVTISADLFNELLEYFENREDVKDGNDGRPIPNDAMRLRMSLERALDGDIPF